MSSILNELFNIFFSSLVSFHSDQLASDLGDWLEMWKSQRNKIRKYFSEEFLPISTRFGSFSILSHFIFDRVNMVNLCSCQWSKFHLFPWIVYCFYEDCFDFSRKWSFHKYAVHVTWNRFDVTILDYLTENRQRNQFMCGFIWNSVRCASEKKKTSTINRLNNEQLFRFPQLLSSELF